ncbi:cysteine hydrolase (plasmid) [Rhodococcus sp. USK10]|uniref:cysteine hydrolase family protein n=1 Tax=Rhodococcus sp. USK10 TaxID=2789739 RepID=UPI001C6037AB|nr:cysteine hydrolase [Rhodococcus sp. USK10]QYB00411.1 cysteine hydrolase [Rhodococcus sp. USK10]
MHKVSIPSSAVERGNLMGLEKSIDPAKTAVIAIDFQRFFIDEGQPMANEHALDILENANRVNAAVRRTGGLVVFTQHSIAGIDAEPVPTEPGDDVEAALRPGSPSYEIHPAIEQLPGDVNVVKVQSSPLHPMAGTKLNEILSEHDIETVIITGLVTNGCCECTARDAFQYGFNVVMATDATAAMTDEEHNAALLNLAIYYSQVLSTEEIEHALASSPAEVL